MSTLSIFIVILFCIGYFCIAIESLTKINKAAIALLMFVGCWTLFMIDPGSYDDRSRDEARRAGMIKIARNGAKIAAHRTFSSRILATSRLAKDLGIGDMVADTRPAKLVIDGVECSGTAMPAIGGAIHSEYVEVPYMRGYRAHYTANALRQLMILAIFDLVC